MNARRSARERLTSTLSQDDAELTAVLDDELGNMQRRIRRHLYLPQMSPFETHLSKLPRPVPWWVIPQDPSEEEELELSILAVFRA